MAGVARVAADVRVGPRTAIISVRYHSLRDRWTASDFSACGFDAGIGGRLARCVLGAVGAPNQPAPVARRHTWRAGVSADRSRTVRARVQSTRRCGRWRSSISGRARRQAGDAAHRGEAEVEVRVFAGQRVAVRAKPVTKRYSAESRVASRRAMASRTVARGSPPGYSGWPKPSIDSPRRSRAAIAARSTRACASSRASIRLGYWRRRAAALRARQDRPDHGAIRMRAGRSDTARGERRHVQLVIGAHDERRPNQLGPARPHLPRARERQMRRDVARVTAGGRPCQHAQNVEAGCGHAVRAEIEGGRVRGGRDGEHGLGARHEGQRRSRRDGAYLRRHRRPVHASSPDERGHFFERVRPRQCGGVQSPVVQLVPVDTADGRLQDRHAPLQSAGGCLVRRAAFFATPPQRSRSSREYTRSREEASEACERTKPRLT